MKPVSDKRRKRNSETSPFRRKLVDDTGECQICGTNPKRRYNRLPEHNQLCCHEILNGPLRNKVLDEPSCLLVVCWKCNGELHDKATWPIARQLSVLKAKSPERYDLKRFLFLRNPIAPLAVTEEEVQKWM